MKLTEVILQEVGIHPTFVEPISILFSIFVVLSILVSIFSVLTKLNNSRIFRSLLNEIGKSINHRNGSHPIPVPNFLKKICGYLIALEWAYGCLFFSLLTTTTIFMFILKGSSIGISNNFTVIAILILFVWMVRFSFIEAQIAFYKAKQIG